MLHTATSWSALITNEDIREWSWLGQRWEFTTILNGLIPRLLFIEGILDKAAVLNVKHIVFFLIKH